MVISATEGLHEIFIFLVNAIYLQGAQFFEFDISNNPHDKNAIKVLSKESGIHSQKNAKEIQGFLSIKYPDYCAKVIETQTSNGADFKVSKILAFFTYKNF